MVSDGDESTSTRWSSSDDESVVAESPISKTEKTTFATDGDDDTTKHQETQEEQLDTDIAKDDMCSETQHTEHDNN